MRHNPGFVQLVQEVKTHIQECSVDMVKTKLEQSNAVIIIDVREDHEVQEGMIPGAMHLGRGILERDIETKIHDKQTEIILYCGGGYRSALAAENLQKMGYRNVWSLDGGIKAWKTAGLGLASSNPQRKKTDK